MDLKFRPLRADEVEVRVAQINERGCSLLLYKDARCDMSILDETVGTMNWQREHVRDNANCIVSIWDEQKQQWVQKEDTGTESNTEKEKGLASDSFKRACVNWGIGRELYTAPFIWIKADSVNISEKNGKKATYDRFSVDEMTAENGRITKLVISNATMRKTVFSWSISGGETATVPKCLECKKPITGYTAQSGNAVSGAEWAAQSLKIFGVTLCVECAKKRKEGSA